MKNPFHRLRADLIVTLLACTLFVVGGPAFGQRVPQTPARDQEAFLKDGQAHPASSVYGRQLAFKDGAGNDQTVDTGSGLPTAPAAGAIFDTNLIRVAGTAVEGPYDMDGTAANERVQGFSPRTSNAAGASVEGVNILINGAAPDLGVGGVGARTPRIRLANDDPAVIDLAALEVLTTALEGDTSAIQIAVQILDDIVAADRARVSPIPGQIGVAAGAGGVDAITQRFTLGTTDATAVNIADIEALLTAIDVDTSAMVVDLAAIEVLLTTIEGDTTAIQTAVQIMDDWNDAGRASVNLIAGQVGIQGGTGGVTALTPRVTLATDVPLPTGTNVLGAVDTRARALATPARTVLGCTAAGTVTYASTATDRQVWVSNADTEDDVCIQLGTAGVPDETDDQTCDLKIGPWPGAGSRKVVALPAGFQGSFECACAPTVDVDADCDLVVTVARD